MPTNASESFPTTPLERYLARSSHDAGMVFRLSIVLRGELLTEVFEQAWFQTIQQHPRIFATLSGRGRRQIWRVGNAPLTDSFHCHQPHETEYGPTSLAASVVNPKGSVEDRKDMEVHPRRGQGATCVVETADNLNWRVNLAFHHACCDGVGALRIIGQLMKSYTKLAQLSRQNETAEIVTRRASEGPASPIHSKASLPDLKNFWSTVRGKNVRLSNDQKMSGRMLRGRSSLAPTAERSATLKSTFDFGAVQRRFGDSHSFDAIPNQDRHQFSREETDQIRDHVKANNLSFNDWGLGITLRVLAELTADQAGPSRYLMVMNPVELRTWADRYASNNHIGIAFVRRTHGDIQNEKEFLRSIQSQMDCVRNDGTSKEMEQGIAIAEKIPGCLWLMEQFGVFTPTAALTCMTGLKIGKRFGVRREADRMMIDELELLDLYCHAPIQAGGQLSVAIWEFNSRLAISCTANPLEPSSTAGPMIRRFLDCWADLALRH